MKNRRQFIQKSARFFMAIAALLSPIGSWIRRAYAQTTKRLLPSGYPKENLIGEDPATIDAGNLEITPLGQFETMGTTDQIVDVNTWRLKVSGKLSNPLALTYTQIQSLPAIERKELMICPGFFVNQGLWKGLSMPALLQAARVAEDAQKVVFHGQEGAITKTESFPLSDVISDRVFLAYELNGVALPRKHGFPLRVVAQGYYGDDWIKYVYQMEVI